MIQAELYRLSEFLTRKKKKKAELSWVEVARKYD